MARATIFSLFNSPSSSVQDYEDAWPEAYYQLGVWLEEGGAENAAAYCFLQALHLKTGYTDADKAVDEMRERLNDGTDFRCVIVRHNADNVLQPFRHQALGQDPLVEEGARKIIGGFIGSVRELNGTASDVRKMSSLGSKLTCVSD